MPIHPRISVSSICTRSWSLTQDIDFWRERDYRLVGVPTYKLADLDAGVQALLDAELEISNVVIPSIFSLGSPERWDEERATVRRVIDATGKLSAHCAYMTTGASKSGMTVDESIDDFVAAVGPTVDYAREAGVRLAVEGSAQANHDMGCIHSLADSFSVAAETGLDVVVELQTAWLERGLGAMVRQNLERVALVQVSDHLVGTDVRLSRAVPGDGDIPLDRLIADILDAGYEGPFDLELLGPRIEEEGYESAVERSVSWLDETLTRLGA